MFELSIAFKYLVPRKRHLSVTLIASMSVAVISLIVWLLIVFLSVTEGMEKAWLKKLTTLNAPVRITPTSKYYSSYYYKSDLISSSSDFSLKTLGEKMEATNSDPYDPEQDPEIPSFWAKPDLDIKGALVDPVKGLVSVLSQFKASDPTLAFQDYEMSGALLKLQLLRSPSPTSFGQESMNFLTQASYLATPPCEQNALSSILIAPSAKDINHLLFLANYRMDHTLEDGAPSLHRETDGFSSRIQQILPFINLKSIKTIAPAWQLPLSLLPEGEEFEVYGSTSHGSWDLMIPTTLHQKSPKHLEKGRLIRQKDRCTVSLQNTSFILDLAATVSVEKPITFHPTLDQKSIQHAKNLQQVQLSAAGSLQGKPLKGTLFWKDLLVDSFELKPDPEGLAPWAYSKTSLPTSFEGESGILLPKGFQDNGVLIGDRGFLSYNASTSSSMQEQRLSLFVAGFYDPGILSVGNKCLLVPKNLTRAINSANASVTFDKIALNGFQVWFNPADQAEAVKKKLSQELESKGLLPYWSVSSYQDFDFAKDLLQQFQSDKVLLSLIGTIILIVACCNIISFLILLVSDKKKEIAILRAMGASTKSIALIFGTCGVIVGLLGCFIGLGGALLTLHHIDTLTSILSALQGHEAFNPAFYGDSLSSSLSSHAVTFIFIITPILALLSGIIPAVKACRLCPSSILRSES